MSTMVEDINEYFASIKCGEPIVELSAGYSSIYRSGFKISYPEHLLKQNIDCETYYDPNSKTIKAELNTAITIQSICGSINAFIKNTIDINTPIRKTGRRRKIRQYTDHQRNIIQWSNQVCYNRTNSDAAETLYQIWKYYKSNLFSTHNVDQTTLFYSLIEGAYKKYN